MKADERIQSQKISLSWKKNFGEEILKLFLQSFTIGESLTSSGHDKRLVEFPQQTNLM